MGPEKLLVYADRENRQIVEEEGVEVVGIEHHDDVGPRRGELFLLRREQFGGFALRTVAFDEEGEHRRMRHPKPGNNMAILNLLGRFTSTRLSVQH